MICWNGPVPFVLRVHRDRLAVARVKTGVETQVADDEVHTAVTGEIARYDAIPPPLAPLEPECGRAHEPPTASVVEDRDGHPLAHDHEIGPAVAVHVPPDGVGHHPHV